MTGRLQAETKRSRVRPLFVYIGDELRAKNVGKGSPKRPGQHNGVSVVFANEKDEDYMDMHCS